MDKGNTIGVRLATFIMEHGRMIKNMGKERWQRQTEINLKGNGSMANIKDN
jgi:hypothetical protein